ncbi:MAG: hypothetical protein RIC52_17530 [Amphiplicatus sp.]
MSDFKPSKYLKHAPRYRLGITIGASVGILVGAVLKDIWIGLFTGAAFGALAAFGAIGTRKGEIETWGGDGDFDGAAD